MLRRVALGLSVGVTLTLAGFVGAGSASAAGPGVGGLGVEQAYSFPAGSFASVSCPSASHCFAVGVTAEYSAGDVIATTDGGASWVDQAIPVGVTSLNSISCASTKDCVAVGASQTGVVGESQTGVAVVATTDGGATWVDQTIPFTVGYLGAVSCPTTKVCHAEGDTQSGGATLVATVNGGLTWVVQVVPPDVTSLGDLRCGSAEDCVAVGAGRLDAAIIATTDGGATWVDQHVSPGVGSLSGLSCSSTQHCVAVGETPAYRPAIVTTTSGGARWVGQKSPGDGAECLERLVPLDEALCGGRPGDAGRWRDPRHSQWWRHMGGREVPGECGHSLWCGVLRAERLRGGGARERLPQR